MKNRNLYLCFLMLFITSCHLPSSDLDEIMMTCYDEAYREEGYDIRDLIDEYEKVLIKEGVLRDGSGSSYLEVLQKMHSDKDFHITSPSFEGYDPFFKVDNDTKLAIFQCENKMLEALMEKDPRWQKFFINSESTEIKVSPDQMYRDMRETMSEVDLNSYYFKLKTLHQFDWVNTNFTNRSSMPAVSTE